MDPGICGSEKPRGRERIQRCQASKSTAESEKIEKKVSRRVKTSDIDRWRITQNYKSRKLVVKSLVRWDARKLPNIHHPQNFDLSVYIGTEQV